MTVDIILHNGIVRTLDSTNSTCSAIAILGDRIAAAGTEEEVLHLATTKTTTIDLDGRCAIPGLVDSHLHFEGYALGLELVDLVDILDLESTLDEVRRYSDENDSREWIEGRGWNQAMWPGGQFPSAGDLDRIIPNRPVLLRHRSGHAAWVNSKAIELTKLDKVIDDPKGGSIQRDENGYPTGILFEKAINLVSDLVPKPTVSEVSQAMEYAQQMALEVGLTGVHDFDKLRCFLAFQELRERGELKIRVVKSIERRRLSDAIAAGLRTGFGDDWIRTGSLKLFADGALGPRTASMIDAYEGELDNRGIVVTDMEEMVSLVTDAQRNGISVAVHAIGDKANHDVLDVFETVAENLQGEQPGLAAFRLNQPNRIEHAQVLHPTDLGRFDNLGIIASMQPIHATADMEMAESHWGRRSDFAYAWRSLIEAGALLAFGSDAPVESIRPLDGIHAAVTRLRGGDPSREGWIPRQRLTVTEAVEGYTAGAAVASGRAGYMGRIKEGFLADLTVLEKDIFTINPHEILSIGIAGTIVGGQFMYRNW